MHDTHVSQGEITASETKLELSDWVPFRRVMNQPGVATMIGHVRVSDVDKDDAGVLFRRRHQYRLAVALAGWRHSADHRRLQHGRRDGSKDGIGGAAVKAINAGVDLVLLRDTAKYFDTVMSALIEADINGEIDQEASERVASAAEPLRVHRRPRTAHAGAAVIFLARGDSRSASPPPRGALCLRPAREAECGTTVHMQNARREADVSGSLPTPRLVTINSGYP